MKLFKVAFCLLITILLTSPLAIAASDNGTSDIIIKTKVLTAYALNPQLNPFDFEVIVDNGTVTLAGAVANTAEQDLAVDTVNLISHKRSMMLH
jgi:hypothetical protein